MMSRTTMQRLVDYVLLNAYSVNSTGLYNGKAGLSLSLFHIARLLNDEYVEDQAYELLREALLSTNKDISFQEGLSGIGYLLHYLITNKFIEADFKELFEEQTFTIKKTIEECINSTQKTFAGSLMPIHFLNAIKNYFPGEEVEQFISSIAAQSAQWLEQKLDNISVVTKENKTEILNFVEMYMKLTDYYASLLPDWELLDRYATLYQADKLISNLSIGYHLKSIAERYQRTYLLAVATANITRGIKNLYPDAMPLSEQINLLYLLHEGGTELPERIKSVEDRILNVNDQTLEYEQYIIKNIRPVKYTAGYQHGIARLLLYLSYRNSPISNHWLFL